MSTSLDPLGAFARLDTRGGSVGYWRLDRVADPTRLARLPFVVRVFLENTLRHQSAGADEAALRALEQWPSNESAEVPFFPGRVILQDFTGVPLIADLAAMREAVRALGADPARVNPLIPAEMVIDHSVIVDAFGNAAAFDTNVDLEYERNRERYAFLRWAQRSFDGLRVVPPGSGIVHQVNLEFLGRVVMTAERDAGTIAYPDTLVGTDSHTTMIGGLGVLGWGVGGIEAEAAMLGEPIGLLSPIVVGVRLGGSLPRGTTATDLVLALTERLRRHGVVGKFVEFFGPGLPSLTVPDRATIANMSPEYGATEGFFPVDEQTLAYLRATGRPEDLVDLVERYCKEQHLFHEAGSAEPEFSEKLDFDLASVEPSLAGPRRPQDRVGLGRLADTFRKELPTFTKRPGEAALADGPRTVSMNGDTISDGSVVIAAITSCTNTSNPSVLVGAGLLARNAVARGLSVPKTVKTSLAPGSPVVVDYLRAAGLLEPLEALGFYTVGFGCTTCIGNSGPLPDDVAKAIDDNDLACAAVLSGNRNFEGRIHPQVRMSFLASPPLVVAFALAGTVDVDLTSDPIGTGSDGRPVFLKDIWPSDSDVASTVASSMNASSYRNRIERLFDGDERWRGLPVPEGDLYEWDPSSTYITMPPFVEGISPTPMPVEGVTGARVLAVLGDSVTTDHISPAGTIPAASPAGRWLTERGVAAGRLHSYGARRGHHDVMVRGTFANIRLRNMLVPGSEGGVTAHLPDGEVMSIYDASQRYRSEGVPLIVLAGKEYGSGSSRDWAAKGTLLLGIRAVIAESYERIHRSNLVQMGVLPLEFPRSSTAADLGLDGTETYSLSGMGSDLEPGMSVRVIARRADGTEVAFDAVCRLDTPTDVRYYRQGGILPAIVRQMANG